MAEKKKEVKEQASKPAPKKEQEIQTRPVTRAVSPFEEMDRLFGSFFPRSLMRPFHWEMPSWPEIPALDVRMPKVDIIDRDNEVVVKAEVAGVKKEDLDISLGENTVTIRGSTSHEEKEEKGNYYRCEMSRGEFSRTLALPSDVDSEKAKATFKDGVLELTLPKIEKSKRRTIKVE